LASLALRETSFLNTTGLDNKPLDGADPDDDVTRLTNLRCQSWLGGLLKSYSRKAA
jgi:hypothetical protein